MKQKENSIQWPDVPCQCSGFCANRGCGCVCGPDEKVMRFFSSGNVLQSIMPMTTEQREFCYSEIEAVEGYDRKDFETSTDAGLARGVLAAWQDYCRDKGML